MDDAGGRSASASTEAATRIMEDFARRTGLSSSGRRVRYLWTDAFAVCNYLSLFGRTSEARYRDFAILLVDQVHHVLGRHRDDDPRAGWISGLSEDEGERHPTAGGLRIGKRLNERGPDDPYDSRLEWDRDGQYYHYLVRWIHALGRAGDVLRSETYYAWAAELAGAAHSAFVYAPFSGGSQRIRWKMSIDLSRALVPSEGAHDPLDGLVTSSALRATWPETSPLPADLDRQIEELAEMCSGRSWMTDDPLGAGGLLMDACWVTRLAAIDVPSLRPLRALSPRLWEDALLSVSAIGRDFPLGLEPQQRLAFRELGLAIGLRGIAALPEEAGGLLGESGLAVAESVGGFASVADRIVSDWLADGAQDTETWRAHEDINAVMLATALVPDAYYGF